MNSSKLIYGVSNWRLIIEKKENIVTILHAETCDLSAILPDEIDGFPVAELGDYALSAKSAEAVGEAIEICFGRPGTEWNNRQLRELTLPCGVKTIGRYAFYNCSSLEKLHFTDNIENIGLSAFMNCRSLQFLAIKRLHDAQGPMLARILSEFTSEFEVRIDISTNEDGQELALLFPEYYEIRDENSAAHLFNVSYEGAGYPYHSVFQQKKLSIPDYDALWEHYISTDYEEPSAVKLAWLRLRYPFELSSASREKYQFFLKSRLKQLSYYILNKKDGFGLRLVLDTFELSAADLEDISSAASEMNWTEASAALLEYRHKHFSTGRNRRFEL